MYEEYFRLSDAPFRLNPDPRFFYGSRSHNKAMAYLHYGLKQAEGFIVITGPVGAGKSMIIGHLLDQLNSSNVVAANLLTSNIEPEDLLSQILSAFRIEPEGEGRTGEIEAFEDYLFDQLNRGRRVLLIIDEAQNLPFKTLEELRMLSNIDYEGTPLFQVFLVGQPEFRATMEAPNMEQLRQRVIASYHLENLSEEETRDYILHRLSIAGWREDPAFTKGAFKAIHAETDGLPRRINTLCNRLMLYCSLEETHEVTAKVVETVCIELREEKLGARKVSDVMPPVATVENPSTAQVQPKSKETKEKSEAEESTTDKASEDEIQTKEAPEVEEKDAVVIPLNNARIKPAASKAKTSEDNTPAQGSFSPQDREPQETPEIVSSSMSVLDRLRAKRAAESRQEATLTDVASAIAAVSAGDNGQRPDNEKNTQVETPGDAPQWRQSLMRSIDETREELKQANASLVRVQKSADNRSARHEKISASLLRAEAALNTLRQARS